MARVPPISDRIRKRLAVELKSYVEAASRFGSRSHLPPRTFLLGDSIFLYRDAQPILDHLAAAKSLPVAGEWAHIVHRGDATPVGIAVSPTKRNMPGRVVRYGFDPVARSVATAIEELDQLPSLRNAEVQLLLDARHSIVCVLGVSRNSPRSAVWLDMNAKHLRDGRIPSKILDKKTLLRALRQTLLGL